MSTTKVPTVPNLTENELKKYVQTQAYQDRLDTRDAKNAPTEPKPSSRMQEKFQKAFAQAQPQKKVVKIDIEKVRKAYGNTAQSGTQSDFMKRAAQYKARTHSGEEKNKYKGILHAVEK